MARLLLVVPEKRDRCGRAAFLGEDGARLLGPFRILATASQRVARRHGNAACDPLLPFGNPPSGSYVVAGSFPPGLPHRRPVRFGRLGGFWLHPVGGLALEAGANGREALMLHGGPLDRRGRLRPTRGGLRVADADLAALIAAINDGHAAGDPLASVELIDAPEDELDPATPEDARGGRRLSPGLAPPRRRRASLRPRTSPAPLALAGLATFAADRGQDPVARRAFLRWAILAVGGLATAACTPTSEWCFDQPDAGPGADGGLAGEICADNAVATGSSGYASGDVAGGG